MLFYYHNLLITQKRNCVIKKLFENYKLFPKIFIVILNNSLLVNNK